MNDRVIDGLLIGVVYPLMIMAVFGGIALLALKADKYREASAKKSVPHRIRK